MKLLTLVTLNILLALQVHNLYAQEKNNAKAPQEEKQKRGQMYDFEFADKLELCEAYTQEFVHWWNEETMTRTIVGVSGDECLFIEQMPNNGEMKCKLSEESRKAVALYYREMANAEQTGGKVKVSMSVNGNQEAKSKLTIDGKDVDVEDPLREAFDNGTCTISGY